MCLPKEDFKTERWDKWSGTATKVSSVSAHQLPHHQIGGCVFFFQLFTIINGCNTFCGVWKCTYWSIHRNPRWILSYGRFVHMDPRCFQGPREKKSEDATVACQCLQYISIFPEHIAPPLPKSHMLTPPTTKAGYSCRSCRPRCSFSSA